MKFCTEKFQQGRPKRRKQGADIFPAGRGPGQGEIRTVLFCFTQKLALPSEENSFQMAGATHFMMLDPHTPQLEGFFGKPVDSLKVG